MSAAKKGDLVPRPHRKDEFELRFATTRAQKGWRALVATQRNATVATWDSLTTSPLETTSTNYRLKGDLGIITRGSESHVRWQHKPTLRGSARVWFYVDGATVFIEQVHTDHPHQTA